MENNRYDFTIDDGVLTEYTGNDTHVEIPAGVTEIGDFAFQDCSSLVSVTIPDSVTKIGCAAFSDCSNLVSVTMPDSVTEIWEGAFSDCSSLASITIPDRVTRIVTVTFNGCSSLVSVSIPDSVTEIDDDAFDGCKNVAIYASAGSFAQKYAKLNTIKFVEKQSKKHFRRPEMSTVTTKATKIDIDGLFSITIPKGMCYSTNAADIGDNRALVFMDARSYYDGECDDFPCSLENPFSAARNLSLLRNVTPVFDFYNPAARQTYKENVLEALVPNALQNSLDAFSRGSFHVSPDMVYLKEIDDMIVSYCYDPGALDFHFYVYIAFPARIYVGQAFISDCSSAEKAEQLVRTWLFSVESIDIADNKTAAPKAGGGKTITYNESQYASIGSFRLPIPDGMRTAENPGALPQLRLVAVPKQFSGGHTGYQDAPLGIAVQGNVLNITHFPEYVYGQSDKANRHNVLQSLLAQMRDMGLRESKIVRDTENLLAVLVTAYSSGSWYSYSFLILSRREFWQGMLHFNGAGTAAQCKAAAKEFLSRVLDQSEKPAAPKAGATKSAAAQQPKKADKAPAAQSTESITSPGDFTVKQGVLSKMKGQATVARIPEGVKRITVAAFKDRKWLRKIILPASVTSFDSISDGDQTGIETIDVDEANPCYASLDGVLFNKDFTELCIFPPARTGEYTMPPTVTRLRQTAFQYTSLTKLTLSPVLDHIGAGYFKRSDTLSALCVSGDDVPTDARPSSFAVRDGMLYSADMTKLFFFPPHCDVCSIPDSVTEIGEYAFSGCSSLTELSIPDGVTEIGSGAFDGSKSLRSIRLPASLRSIGGEAFNCCQALTEITIPDGVTEIEERAFSYCEALTKITIPDGVTKIGKFAFSHCEALTEIAIPDGVTEILDNTFLACKSLRSVHLPASLQSTGWNAFKDCKALTEITIPDGVTEINAYSFSDTVTVRVMHNSPAERAARNAGCKNIKVIPNAEDIATEKERQEREERRREMERQIAEQEVIIAENRGLFGESARKRKAAKEALEKLQSELARL